MSKLGDRTPLSTTIAREVSEPPNTKKNCACLKIPCNLARQRDSDIMRGCEPVWSTLAGEGVAPLPAIAACGSSPVAHTFAWLSTVSQFLSATEHASRTS